MSLQRGKAGAKSAAVAGDYRYVTNKDTGALELWKKNQKIGVQSPDGSWFRTSVSTGVGSLHLGGGESTAPAHSVSSAGQNVVFKNEAHSATDGASMVWFPPWQGLRRDIAGAQEPAVPTYLQFGDYWASYDPNGSGHATNIVGYDFTNTVPTSVVVSRMQIMAGETYSGKLTHSIMSSPKGVELHSTSQTVNITAGNLFWLEYPSLYFARQGDSLRETIRKEDGQLLKVRGGLVNTAHPFRRLIARSFTDVMVGNVHYGDIKEHYSTIDHDGWIFLNGRQVSTLRASQQAICASLGISGSLPNSIDRVSMGAGGQYPRGTSGGGVKISKAMLPNITITGRTDAGDAHRHGSGTITTAPNTGNHDHLYDKMGVRGASGNDFNVGSGSHYQTTTSGPGSHSHTLTGDTADESTHKHYFTSDSINGNVAQADFVPMYTAFGKFIYLGL